MKLTEKCKKIIIFIASIVLVAIITLLYFLDDSLEWGAEKIFSLIFVDFWAMFVIASYRYIYLKFKDISVEQSFRIGLHIAINGVVLPLLIAPYWGSKYYFQSQID